MKFIIADLHLHSKYSRAVSQEMVLEKIASWAKIKGVNLLGTGDFTHPLWIRELHDKLREVEKGIYCLKTDKNKKIKFVVNGEISSIYSQGGRVRKIHNLIFTPNLEIAAKVNLALKRKGANLISDGRPIIGLSAKKLTELVLETNPDCLIIPAHIWTPWFSLFGSRSGFDSLKECFGQFSQEIHAVETGLSSDPEMNWQLKELEKRTIVSFSDAHSPAKIGREATILKSKNKKESKFDYQDLVSAFKRERKGKWFVSSTIEFHPEEGKYHHDGHRKCQIRRSPLQTILKGTTCPVCQKPLTLGVCFRVAQLSNQKIKAAKKRVRSIMIKSHPQNKQPPFFSSVPLLEIIAEVEKKGVNSQCVKNTYLQMIRSLGTEMDILLNLPLKKIGLLFGAKMGEGIAKNRLGKISIEPGFDGQFGTVKIWKAKKGNFKEKQTSLF